MKQKIKVKVLVAGCGPVISAKGDWIDLRAAEDIKLAGPCLSELKDEKGNTKIEMAPYYIPLGVAMKLPDGMEGVAAPRSSSATNFNILQSNSPGIIDTPYCGDNDQWHMPVLPIGKVNIKKGDRICQFRVQLSQKATFWQKLKWLFSSGVEIEYVDSLGNPNRGGLGHSGKR